MTTTTIELKHGRVYACAKRRDRAMTYRTKAGEIVGRVEWTYP